MKEVKEIYDEKNKRWSQKDFTTTIKILTTLSSWIFEDNIYRIGYVNDDGKKIGEWITYKGDVIFKVEFYENGEFDGEQIEYNGGKFSRKVREYKNGVLDGKVTEYNRDNSIRVQRSYKNGKLHGLTIYPTLFHEIWYYEGKVVSEDEYYHPPLKIGCIKFDDEYLFKATSSLLELISNKFKVDYNDFLINDLSSCLKVMRNSYTYDRAVNEFASCIKAAKSFEDIKFSCEQYESIDESKIRKLRELNTQIEDGTYLREAFKMMDRDGNVIGIVM